MGNSFHDGEIDPVTGAQVGMNPDHEGEGSWGSDRVGLEYPNIGFHLGSSKDPAGTGRGEMGRMIRVSFNPI